MVKLGLKLEDPLKQKGLENKSIAAKENIEKRQNEEISNFVNQDKQISAQPDLNSSSIRPPNEIEKINTRDGIANFANTSHDTVDKAKDNCQLRAITLILFFCLISRSWFNFYKLSCAIALHVLLEWL
jgi:hypothetical protein